MKILQVNKYYYPRGGADKYFLSLADSQAKNGNEVAVFAMHHPNNLPSPWSRYFVSHLSFNRQNWRDKLKSPGRVLYSLEAKRKFSRLLEDFRPDIIHLHNIYHQLSPSILDAAAKKNIPVVMHLHDYKIISANHAMFAPPDHFCNPGDYRACLKRRCVKDSWPATILAILEMKFHHVWLKIYERKVWKFIAPSEYMKSQVELYHPLLTGKIKVIYNSFNPELKLPRDNFSSSDYLLYFGRLGPEKGLDTLIKAASQGAFSLKIIGSGPEEDYLKDLSNKLGAKVDFLGFLTGDNLIRGIMESKAVVIPSVWPENMPLSMLEAMSLGKTVIASRVGGMTEIIEHEKNGLLFKAGDIDDLVKAVLSLDSLNMKEIGRRAKETALKYPPEKNYRLVMDIYEELLKKDRPF